MTQPPPKTLPGLRGRFQSGERLALGWLALGSAAIAEIGATSGVDALVLDLQHGLFDRLSLEAAVGTASGKLPVLVRCAENTPAAISRALDCGSDGVIVPLVETAAEAAAAVAATRFPPVGKRSGGGVRPLAMGFGDYLAKAEGIALGVMIETETGVTNAAAIAAVPGIDFIFIGTGDLGLSYAGHADPDAAKHAAIAAIFAACRSARVPVGIFTISADAARERLAEGWCCAVAWNDIDLIKAGASAASKAARA
jgi:2-keto-3-deoxy-L-rhamnonate aldolase RhmA